MKQKLSAQLWRRQDRLVLYFLDGRMLTEIQVYAAASEDMDTLCFEAPILLRHLTFSEQRKEPIQEIHLDKAMVGLGFTREQVQEPIPFNDITRPNDGAVY